MTNRPPRINIVRLQRHLDELAGFGALPGGGVCRLAFSEADKRARDFVEAHMRRLGLSVRIDAIGNMLGMRAGGEGATVLAGSHLDTVATGGRVDGALGVMAALEAIESMNEIAITTRRPVGVVVFANEEGARFTPDMMGSLVFRGALAPEVARTSVDPDGVSVGEELDRLGYAGDADFAGMPLEAYLELHIEQGPILEREGRTIGVVDHVQGIKWLAFTLTGAAAHAGTTPIEMRRDAGYVAAGIVHYARTLASELEGQGATVGSLTLWPNVTNVVAERARVVVDLRNPDAHRLRAAEERLRRFAADAARAERVEVTCRVEADAPPVRFDAAVVSAIEESAGVLGYRARRMVSGAGHDAQILASRYPAGMIFVPSRGGISHNVNEFTAAEDVEAGANVLLASLLKLA